MNLAAATQMMHQFQAQQQQQLLHVHEQARRAQMLKQAQNIALAQHQQTSPAPSMQAILTQTQLQDALLASNVQHRGGLNFAQAQAQAQAQVHAQQQAQAHMHQAQLQAQARQNMAALANLTPAQLQALGANPALAQALLQARATQQQQAATAQAVNIPQGVDPAVVASFRARQQQQVSGNFMPPPVDNVSPASSSSGSPPNSGSMSKEQRRMALACVALQLAHSGLSVDQAIHSGIMGGMSVTDVRFIVEVYNAEVARTKDASDGRRGPPDARDTIFEGADGISQRSTQHTAASGHASCGSPAHSSSYAGSDAGNSAPGRSRGGSVVGSAADLMHADLAFGDDGTQAPPFNAFSYGFFGESSGGDGELLGDLEADVEGGVYHPRAPWQQSEGSGQPDEGHEAPHKQQDDDVAERLAKLDLGYGFF